MRIIGIDPGLRNMGWGILEVEGSKILHIANGVCHSGTGELSHRLLSLYDQLSDVFNTYTPDSAAIEKTFVNKDGVGTLKLGHARAIGILVPARMGLDVAEYAPNSVKKIVAGVGHADKKQIEYMVRMQLPKIHFNGADAVDALAIAMCHAHYAQFSSRLKTAITKSKGII